jgi:hypothetical protein
MSKQPIGRGLTNAAKLFTPVGGSCSDATSAGEITN